MIWLLKEMIFNSLKCKVDLVAWEEDLEVDLEVVWEWEVWE